jgi:glucan biosynthesis protein C
MKSAANRSFWIDNLKSFITVLVVAHHAALAYTTFSFFDKTTYINSTHPVVDNSRWIGLDVFASFNDAFFMALMFLISGLFFFSGLKNKGRLKLLANRGKRLGVAFVFAELFIIPIAYIPAYYLANHQFNISSFITDYLIHQQWPVGPPWFIWLLLAFNLLATSLPERFYTGIAHLFIDLIKKPWSFFTFWFLIVALSLIPLSLWIGQYTWTGFGPFDFQLNRVLFYFVFFLFGAILGSVSWEEHLIKNDRLLNQPSLTWIILSLVSFGIVELINFWGYGFMAVNLIGKPIANLIFMLFFIATTVTTCFAFMIIFRNYRNRTSTVWKSLSKNAYGIYLFHYVFITWLQFALLNIGIPAGAKFLLVFLVSLIVSWGLVDMLKRLKWVSSII